MVQVKRPAHRSVDDGEKNAKDANLHSVLSYNLCFYYTVRKGLRSRDSRQLLRQKNPRFARVTKDIALSTLIALEQCAKLIASHQPNSRLRQRDEAVQINDSVVLQNSTLLNRCLSFFSENIRKQQ